MAPILWVITLAFVSGVLTARALWPGEEMPENSCRRAVAIMAALMVAAFLLVYGKDLIFLALIMLLGPS